MNKYGTIGSCSLVLAVGVFLFTFPLVPCACPSPLETAMMTFDIELESKSTEEIAAELLKKYQYRLRFKDVESRAVGYGGKFCDIQKGLIACKYPISNSYLFSSDLVIKFVFEGKYIVNVEVVRT